MTTGTDPFLSALQTFAQTMTNTFALSVAFQPEDQLKPAVAQLLRSAGAVLGGAAVQVVTEVRVSGLGGRPDMGLTTGGALVGYIELKAPGRGANPNSFRGDDLNQWNKFKNLPNLIYTDGNEWARYQNGERIGTLIRLSGDITKEGAAAASSADARALLDMLREFLRWEPIAPRNPRALAELLAPLCRLLRTDVVAALDDPRSNLNSLKQDWQRYFFPDADNRQFADAYAQTLTYALLLARLSGAVDLSVPQAQRSLRTSHRLLADVLGRLGDDAARDEIKVAADLLERVIAGIDPSIFASHTGDPWLYFYEDFLAAYDPKMRKDRGVYYTPVEVVQCQVRLVAELLADRFGAEFSFVDDQVVALDPATGTGTYILAAIKHGLDQIAAVRGPGARVSAATIAARNMHAFELLVGPYAVAHLRLTQQILAEGGSLPSDGAHIYLADTLESPNLRPENYLPMPYKLLAEEHERAIRVKQATPVLVCIGNPPYDRQEIATSDQGSEQRKGGWVRFGEEIPGGRSRPIFQDFVDPLRAAGLGVHAKNLYNDYVYFWRWALWKVFEQQSGHGIVSFITASSYLRGEAFAGVRKVMRETFDELWIINLEGDNLGARKTENVFVIQTPVAIAIGVRSGPADPSTPARVHYTRITGTREDKLAALGAVTRFADLHWQPGMTGWLDPLLPENGAVYRSWPLLTDLFPWQANGMQFKRTWPIGETREVLERRWAALLALPPSARGAAMRETDARTANRTITALDYLTKKLPSLASLPAGSPPIPPQRYAFRSFDRHWMLPDARLCDRPRPELRRAHSDQQIYLTSLLTDVLGEGPGAVATALIPDLHHFRGSFGGVNVIPLWRDPTATQPNITDGLLEALATVYGQTIAPDDLLGYCYALLATPEYVRRFWDELLIPGPRIPLTRDPHLFAQAAALGKQLIWLHTFGERFVPAGKRAGRIPTGTARIARGTPTDPARYPKDYRYDATTQELHVGDGLFSGVRPDVWDFSISGLQVLDSWLGYRMLKRSGKASSPLDELRPAGWQFDDELLELLWLLEASLDLLPQASALLANVLAGDLLTAGELPAPSDAERRGPAAAGASGMPLFDSAGIDVEEEQD
ncbi:MAG: hypothetical protein OHK0022_23590 [Roseiflexaceae bacterium]